LADLSGMRFERLTLVQGRHALTLPFHPCLTVIAGVGPEEREGLVGELLGALAGTRRGATLELVDDSGQQFAIHRGETAADDKIIDRDSGVDVGRQFSVGNRVDLLAIMGLTAAEARSRARLSASDLGDHDEAVVQRLANQDQEVLWSTAERLLVCNVRVDVESQPPAEPANEIDTDVVEQVEATHRGYLAATKRARSATRIGGTIVGVGMASVIAIAMAISDSVALAPLAVVAMAALFIVGRHHEMRMAEMTEWDALAMAGISAYDQLHRVVDGGNADRVRRKRLAEALAEQADMAEKWRALAGDVPVKWALERKARVLDAAGELVDADDTERLWPVRPTPVGQAEIAERLVVRLAQLRHVGGGGESFPLILDEPLADADTSVKQWVLEMIGRSAGSPQVVYLTADEDVAAWARMEAIAGHVAIVEPASATSLVDLS
jgi:hypothetical protein